MAKSPKPVVTEDMIEEAAPAAPAAPAPAAKPVEATTQFSAQTRAEMEAGAASLKKIAANNK